MRLAATVLAITVFTALPLAAQGPFASAPSCLSDWSCRPNRAPLGLYVREVGDGGRYVTLEDGSVWEVEISDRATTASWQPDDFVAIRDISAPRGDYEHQLTRIGELEQRAATRLAGRRAPVFRGDDIGPGAPPE